MKTGKDYIVFALDVASAEEAQRYVKMLNGKVGMFKIGLELFVQAGPDIIKRVRDLSSAGIFLDLKFHDISETVRRVMERVAEFGVELVTVHCSSSQKMLAMAVKGGDGVGVLGVTLLTDHDSSVIKAGGFKDVYVDDIQAFVMKRAQMAYSAGCRGVVCSGQEVEEIKSKFGKDFIAVTPGIRPAWTIAMGEVNRPDSYMVMSKQEQKLTSDDQKRITTPAMAVKAGADLIVVGRPIKRAAEPAKAAEQIAMEIDLAIN